MIKEVSLIIIFFLLNYCLLLAHISKAANIPFSSTWVRYKGNIYEIRTSYQRDTRYILCKFFNEKGKEVTNLNPKDKHNLILALYYADNRYLKGIHLQELKLLNSSMRKVLLYNYAISGLAKFQDFLMKLGVNATFAYFGDGLKIANVIGKTAYNEIIDSIEVDPEKFAKEMGKAFVRAGLSRLSHVIEFARRRQTIGVGTSARHPFDFKELRKAHSEAEWVDCFLIPATELIVSFQRKPSLINQLKDLSMVVTQTAFSGIAKKKHWKIVQYFLQAKDIWGAFENICPATARFVKEVRLHYKKWENARREFLKLFRENLPLTINFSGTTIVALVDSSGSMQTTDPHNLRISALKMLIRTLGSNIKLGIIDFDNRVKILAMPMVLDGISSPVRQHLLKVLQKIDSNGGTNIAKGLKVAVDVLKHDKDTKKIIVLLTDGQDNHWHGEFDSEGQNIVVHTIALSDKADRVGLSKISAYTGGECEIARNAGDLQRIIINLFGLAQGEEVVFLKTGKIKQGQHLVYPVWIEKGQQETDYEVIWPGSNIDLTLISPNHIKYTIRKALLKGYGIAGHTFKLIRLKKPIQGKWQVELFGRQISPKGENFTLRVATRHSLLKTRWIVKPLVPEVGEECTINLVNKGKVLWKKAEITVWDDSNTPVKKIENMNSVLAQLSGFSSQTIYSFIPLKTGVKRIHIVVYGKTDDGNLVMRSYDHIFRIAARGHGVYRKYEINPFIRR